MFNFPNSTTPASLIRAMTVASSSGTKSRKSTEAFVVRIPFVYIWSLTAMGIPCRGPQIFAPPNLLLRPPRLRYRLIGNDSYVSKQPGI